MNRCKDCGFWEPDCTGWKGECVNLTQDSDGLILLRGAHSLPSVNTHQDFGCIHFEKKERGPFSVEKHEAKTYDSWHVAFCNQVAPTLFPIQKVAKRWCDWLNELWAQKEKEPPDKNCPDCTAFPCWTHQFFTGHAKFCCDKFERRECRSCAHWVFKRHIHFHTVGKCKKFGHGFTNDDTCCREWTQKEQESLDKDCRCECRTCSFWKDRRPFSDGIWGSCEYAEMRNALPVSCGKAIAGGAMSGIKDCILHTHEAFGCNQWTNL